MTAANILNNRWLAKTYMPNSVAASILLLTHARRHGLSWHELGLATRTRRRGLGWAAGSLAGVSCAYTVAIAAPVTRRAFVDQRARDTARGVAFQALVPVLFGTVLLEEVAFRGVLWGLLRRRHGDGPATAVSSVLFGLWHILPTREIARHNRAVDDVVGGSRSLVVWSVAFTTAAGVVLSELRRRSGSLIAPAGLHWATNGLGYVYAAIARHPLAGTASTMSDDSADVQLRH
jgi:membrane protease YdiL (CAAX protease family)